jgi:hypothetical protein
MTALSGKVQVPAPHRVIHRVMRGDAGGRLATTSAYIGRPHYAMMPRSIDHGLEVAMLLLQHRIALRLQEDLSIE